MNDYVERLTVGEAARFAGVDVKTIRRWCDTGKLPVTRPDTSTHRRIARSDLLRILNGPVTPQQPEGGANLGAAGRRGRGGVTLLDTLTEVYERLDDFLPARPEAMSADELDKLQRVLGGPYSTDNGTSGLLGELRLLMRDLTSESEDRQALSSR